LTRRHDPGRSAGVTGSDFRRCHALHPVGDSIAQTWMDEALQALGIQRAVHHR